MLGRSSAWQLIQNKEKCGSGHISSDAADGHPKESLESGLFGGGCYFMEHPSKGGEPGGPFPPSILKTNKNLPIQRSFSEYPPLITTYYDYFTLCFGCYHWGSWLFS